MAFLQILLLTSFLIAGEIFGTNCQTTVKAIENLPDGYKYFPFLNAAYKIHTERLRWSEAKEKCIGEGATLAVIDTESKVQVIASLKESKVYLWVGISRESKAMPWLSIDGETVVSYLPWAPLQPSCSDDCIAIDNRDRGVRNDNCRVKKGFVCEIKE